MLNRSVIALHTILTQKATKTLKYAINALPAKSKMKAVASGEEMRIDPALGNVPHVSNIGEATLVTIAMNAIKAIIIEGVIIKSSVQDNGSALKRMVKSTKVGFLFLVYRNLW